MLIHSDTKMCIPHTTPYPHLLVASGDDIPRSRVSMECSIHIKVTVNKLFQSLLILSPEYIS